MMRYLKLILIAIIMLGGLLTLISLLMPSRVMVARTVLIDAPPSVVFEKINNLQTWPQWFLPIMDSSSKYSDSSAHELKWMLNGIENRIILKDSMQFGSHFLLMRPGHNPLNLYFTADSIEVVRSLQVEMRIVRDLKWYPWDKFSGIVEDNVAGHAYEATLKSLKAYIEKR